MSRVWAARHELIGRDVALKVVATSRDCPDITSRFLREARIVGKFRHPNIVSVIDAGELPNQDAWFIVMELLEGIPMADLFTEGQPLSAGLALSILIEVCRGLEVAHEAGVVHRDIKPENVILANHPAGGVVPKIVDFGISKSLDFLEEQYTTIAGQILGTPAYMSPEQALGRVDVDHRADIWAMGVVLYEALAGHAPFRAPNNHTLLMRIVDAPHAPLPAHLPHGLCAIVDRCLQKAPERRFQTARELRAEMQSAFDALPAEHRGVEPIVVDCRSDDDHDEGERSHTVIPIPLFKRVGPPLPPDKRTPQVSLAPVSSSRPLDGRSRRRSTSDASESLLRPLSRLPTRHRAAVAAVVSVASLTAALLTQPSGGAEIALSPVAASVARARPAIDKLAPSATSPANAPPSSLADEHDGAILRSTAAPPAVQAPAQNPGKQGEAASGGSSRRKRTATRIVNAGF